MPPETAGSLRAGAAAVDITPKAGTHIAGSGRGEHRPAQVVLDPLHARALVLDSGPRKVCILALDVTIVSREWTEKIRDAAAPLGFAPEAVMVYATQTHSAPSLGNFLFDPDFPEVPPELAFLRGGEQAYFEFASERAVDAVRQANDRLRPVQLGVNRAVLDGIAFNRRGITRDGGIVMPWMFSSQKQPLGPTHIVCLEGPVDPEVGVLCLRDDSLALHAMLLHYTCHPVNLFATAKHAVSADWPGAWADEMRARFGDELTPVIANGCCGNINPWPAFTPDFQPDHRRMGRALAEAATAAIEHTTFDAQATLDFRLRTIPLPLKPPDTERVNWARDLLTQHPEPMRAEDGSVDPAWVRAASVTSVELMRKRSPNCAYEIQAFRIGDAVLVGLPGEPFVEGQLALKLASPAAFTFVAHMMTQYVGYIPTDEAQRRGGHEVDFSYWAKLAPGALDKIVANATELICELFHEPEGE